MSQGKENANMENPVSESTQVADPSNKNIDVLIDNIGKVVKGHREQIVQIIPRLCSRKGRSLGRRVT